MEVCRLEDCDARLDNGWWADGGVIDLGAALTEKDDPIWVWDCSRPFLGGDFQPFGFYTGFRGINVLLDA